LARDDRVDQIVLAQSPVSVDRQLRGDRVQVGERARIERAAIED
jgi:hypothetical protein